ncbi:MAG TPA: hypothetical protein VKU85_17915 [bacterium]|nr:hypothetical protein [bacterium]
MAIVAPVLLAGAVLAGLWSAGRSANPGAPGFRLDDAWIHQVYGRGLLHHGYLAYNDGVPTTGCTSPLWAVCLTPVHAVAGGDPDTLVAAVMALGVLLQLAAAAAAGILALRLTDDVRAGVAAGALVAMATPWATAAYSGMEVQLTGLLLLLGMGAAVSGRWTPAGVWLALAALARPEAAVVTVVTAAMVPWISGGDRSAREAVLRLLLPSVIGGALVAAHHLWASGSPLPATFQAKSAASLTALPARTAAAFRDILPAVPPFAGGIAWLALGGLFAGRLAARSPAGGDARRALPGRVALRSALPAIAGLAFLLANLFLIDPVDPDAFYHQRYLLPAVPLLLTGLAVGAHGWGTRLRGRAAAAPLAALVLLAGIGAARTVTPESRHLHNDVRNINEVQRRIGTWLGENLPAGTRIASSDAGAVRYFSELPVVDVLGLNTPEMLDPTEEFLRAHPVAAVVLLPAWFRGLDETATMAVYGAQTEDYTVTGNPNMRTQIVLAARPGAAADGPVRVRFVGFRPFAVDLIETPGASP